MLEKSHLFTFIDQNSGFTLHYFEGQSVIKDLAIIHDVKGEGFHFFRDAVLTFLPMISYLKNGEQFGFYIDSDQPWFRFKLEANAQGYMRTLLNPELFNDFPQNITGRCRLSKILPGQREAYNTIIELQNLSVGQISNMILRDSYQVKAQIHLSQKSDQALLIHRLPDRQVDREPELRPDFSSYFEQEVKAATAILDAEQASYEKITSHFKDRGMDFLSATQVEFKCSCSRERMLQGVASLAHSESIDDVFQKDEALETKCDYCKTYYLITKQEVLNFLAQ